jgi:hypothetical protein
MEEGVAVAVAEADEDGCPEEMDVVVDSGTRSEMDVVVDPGTVSEGLTDAGGRGAG